LVVDHANVTVIRFCRPHSTHPHLIWEIIRHHCRISPSLNAPAPPTTLGLKRKR
jgi:hypothetical protein